MTNDPTRAGRKLDLTVDIDATLEEVWQALTTGDGIARWFGPYAAVTPGEGGNVSVGWDPKEMWDSPVARQQLSARFRTIATDGESHPVFGDKGLRGHPPVASLNAGDACRLALGGIDVDATLAMRKGTRAIAFVVPKWNDALLFVEREGMNETHTIGVWLSLYGVPEATSAPLTQGLAGLQAALSVA